MSNSIFNKLNMNNYSIKWLSYELYIGGNNSNDLSKCIIFQGHIKSNICMSELLSLLYNIKSVKKMEIKVDRIRKKYDKFVG